MKKIILGLFSLALTGCTVSKAINNENRVIPQAVDLGEYGAESVLGMGDHKDSSYFPANDYFNMTSNDHLTILSHFQTYQQTSEWSCGVVAAMMVLNYNNALGDYNEETLAEMRDNGLNEEATTLDSMMHIFEKVGGFTLTSTRDYDPEKLHEEITLATIQEYLNEGIPMMVCWNDWGGHWQVIIGYDDMGTKDYTGDDVIIVADPYDTTDHHQDGYGVYGAERFYYNWTMYDFFSETAPQDRDMLFLAAKKA